jgi:hypothetical protein
MHIERDTLGGRFESRRITQGILKKEVSLYRWPPV